MTTPNMALTLPVVSQTPGPTWASEINADLSLIDSHNHTSGKGALVPVAGLNINADLSLATNALTNVKSLGLLDQVSLVTLNSVYANAGELWWNDGAGNNVQITSNGAVNVGATGNIGGMIGSAAVNYVSGPLAYEFIDENGNHASLQALAVRFGSVTVSQSPGSATYSLRLPVSTPAATSFVTATVSGSTATLAFNSQTGYITRQMQAAVNQQIQSSASSYSVTTGSATNLSDQISITTTGRPVILGINSTGSGSCISILPAADGPVGGKFWFQIGGDITASIGHQNVEASGKNTEYFEVPSSSMNFLWTPVAGSYTVQLRGFLNTGGAYVAATLSFQEIKIYAYEL